jgi:mRNA-degrading endonuclease toxin of MazEF toxin-antitoxin module
MRSPRRGQVFRLKSDPVGKPRPVLIVSIDSLNGGLYLLTVPFYGDEDGRRRHLKSCAFFSRGEYGLEKDCVAKADEISMLRASEIKLAEGPMAELDEDGMRRVAEALSYCLGLNG